MKSGRASEIADAFDVVVVSLDGPKEIHDKIRGVAGTYDKAFGAIKLLKTRGVRVGVNSVVTPWNIEILPHFIEELHSLVDFAQVQPIHPYPPPPQNTPSHEAISKLLDYLMKLKHSDPSFLAVPTDSTEYPSSSRIVVNTFLMFSSSSTIRILAVSPIRFHLPLFLI